MAPSGLVTIVKYLLSIFIATNMELVPQELVQLLTIMWSGFVVVHNSIFLPWFLWRGYLLAIVMVTVLLSWLWCWGTRSSLTMATNCYDGPLFTMWGKVSNVALGCPIWSAYFIKLSTFIGNVAYCKYNIVLPFNITYRYCIQLAVSRRTDTHHM